MGIQTWFSGLYSNTISEGETYMDYNEYLVHLIFLIFNDSLVLRCAHESECEEEDHFVM